MSKTKTALIVTTAAMGLLGGMVTAGAQVLGPSMTPPAIPPNMLFNGMDTNKDKTVSKQEYLDYYAKRFDSMDKNKDGKITADELPTKNKGKANALFNEIDANKDGVVTKQEYLDYYAKKFDAADKNHDGKLTQDELPARPKPSN
jgi:Ca2+-binding EF-hand superfamily protein